MAKKNKAETDTVVEGIGNETAEEVYAELDKRGTNWPSNLAELNTGTDEEDEISPTPPAPVAPRITARGNKREEGKASPIARRQNRTVVSRRVLTSGNVREDS